jgi:hypothetical protein
VQKYDINRLQPLDYLYILNTTTDAFHYLDGLYLNLSHIMSVFSLYHQHSNIILQHSVHNHISISHVSLFYFSQHHHSTLNHFIYFMDNEFEKIN